MNRNRFTYGLILYLAVTILLLFFIFLNQRTYDGWILDGIAVPVAVYILISITALTFINNNKKLVVIAGIFIATISMIPGAKHTFFYDVFDGPGHYRFASQIASLGYIPQGEFYSVTYGNNCGMHIFTASFSLASGISVNDFLRFLIPLLFGLMPFIIYLVGHKILDNRIMKYAIIASSFPVIQGYDVWGTILAFIPYLLLIAVLLRFTLSKTYDRTLFLVLVVSSFTLIDSHAVTPFFVSLLFLGVFLISAIFAARRKSQEILSTRKCRIAGLSYILLFLTWWLTVDTVNLDFFIGLSASLFNREIPAIPPRFFQLSLIPRLQILLVQNAANTVIFALSLIGLIVLINRIRKKQLSSEAKAFYLLILTLVGVVAVFVVAQVVIGFGVFSYQRFLYYGIPWCFFLIGLLLSSIDQRVRNLGSKPILAFFTFFIASMMFFCLIQFFPPQSLVPRSSAISQSLPGDPYILDISLVNTIYQKQMISFANSYSRKGIIIADSVTRCQCYGFSSPPFFSRIEYPSPLVSGLSQNLEWSLFLLHSTKAGPFEEKPENRTDPIIQSLLLNSGNLVYNNGESYILYNTNQNSIP